MSQRRSLRRSQGSAPLGLRLGSDSVAHAARGGAPTHRQPRRRQAGWESLKRAGVQPLPFNKPSPSGAGCGIAAHGLLSAVSGPDGTRLPHFRVMGNTGVAAYRGVQPYIYVSARWPSVAGEQTALSALPRGRHSGAVLIRRCRFLCATSEECARLRKGQQTGHGPHRPSGRATQPMAVSVACKIEGEKM